MLGREAAGLHLLSEALEGETAALGRMGDSWTGSVFSSQCTIPLNIWSVEADMGTRNQYNNSY